MLQKSHFSLGCSHRVNLSLALTPLTLAVALLATVAAPSHADSFVQGSVFIGVGQPTTVRNIYSSPYSSGGYYSTPLPNPGYYNSPFPSFPNPIFNNIPSPGFYGRPISPPLPVSQPIGVDPFGTTYYYNSDRGVPYRGRVRVDNSTLVNPTLVNPRITDSVLINPVIVNPVNPISYPKVYYPRVGY